jgi:hypothetical protein
MRVLHNYQAKKTRLRGQNALGSSGTSVQEMRERHSRTTRPKAMPTVSGRIANASKPTIYRINPPLRLRAGARLIADQRRGAALLELRINPRLMGPNSRIQQLQC